VSERPLTSHERRAGRPWDVSYTEGTPPWDAGGPQPEVVRLEFDGPLLDAGCGSGDNAIEIARRGIEVVGVDVASTAIRQARAKAAGLPVTFVVADALQLHRLGRTFPSVLDCGLFHTFDDEERLAYVDSLAAVTEGVLHLLCVSDAAPGTEGPRRISQAELRAAFAAGWNVASIDAGRLLSAFGTLPAWVARIERAAVRQN
jgi:SAM-dependent methyltransferase